MAQNNENIPPNENRLKMGSKSTLRDVKVEIEDIEMDLIVSKRPRTRDVGTDSFDLVLSSSPTPLRGIYSASIIYTTSKISSNLESVPSRCSGPFTFPWVRPPICSFYPWIGQVNTRIMEAAAYRYVANDPSHSSGNISQPVSQTDPPMEHDLEN